MKKTTFLGLILLAGVSVWSATTLFKREITGTATSTTPWVWTNNNTRCQLAAVTVEAVVPGEEVYATVTVSNRTTQYTLPAMGAESFTNAFYTARCLPVLYGGTVTVTATTTNGVEAGLFISE